MCLEQTINRSQKSSAGIIGSSKRKHFVAQWEMIYHEMLAVSNLHREVSGSKPGGQELSHEFTTADTDADEKKVQAMTSFIEGNENPFRVLPTGEAKLHNILTQEIMTEEIRSQILSVKEIGAKKYSEFRRERFVMKSKRLSDTIHRTNLKTFNSIRTDKSQTPKKTAKKKYAYAQKVLDIARVRNCDMKEIFAYDLQPSSSLLDEEGLMTKPQKSLLCHELEKSISPEDYKPPSQWERCETTYLIGVMAYIRRTKTKDLRTFGDLCEAMFTMVLNICQKVTASNLCLILT